MRRRDREITDIHEKLEIIDRCMVCRLALSDGDQPYIVPLNYGYAFNGGVLTLFFHGASSGKKMDIIRTNSKACFEIDTDHKLLEADGACEYGYAYKSVVGTGGIIILDSIEDKIAGLRELMKHQTGKNADFMFGEKIVEKTAVFKMIVKEFTGKMMAVPADLKAGV